MYKCTYVVLALFSLKQAEIAETERELKDVLLKKEVLKKEKQLLEQFASHVSKIHSVKVTAVWLGIYVC